jgi:hypothetical protein
VIVLIFPELPVMDRAASFAPLPAEGYPELFIVGTSRCGSTMLSQILRQHPDILSISEFLTQLITRNFAYSHLSGEQLWTLLSKPSPIARMALAPHNFPDEFLYPFGGESRFTFKTLPAILYVTLPHLTSEPDALYFELEPVIRARPRAPIAEQYRFLFGWLAQRLGKKMWAERSGASLIYAPTLIKHFPQAKFVHLIRDGRDVSMSITAHKATTILVRAWYLLRALLIDYTRPPFLLGASRLLATMEPLTIPTLQFERALTTPMRAEKVGRFWSRIIELGQASLAQLPPAQRLDIRYEDLVAQPRETLSRFVEFVDPRLKNDAWLDAVCQIPSPRPVRWRKLPEQERAALEQACRPGLEMLGYVV